MRARRIAAPLGMAWPERSRSDARTLISPEPGGKPSGVAVGDWLVSAWRLVDEEQPTAVPLVRLVSAA